MSLVANVGITIGAAALAASPASAKQVLLQTVEVDGQSAEGGEARLYRILPSGECRIEAIYYGEGGRVGFEFRFGSRLKSALKREYRYKVPYYVPPQERRVVSVRLTTLMTAAGRRTLPAEFESHKGYFRPELLSTCSARQKSPSFNEPHSPDSHGSKR